MKNHIAFAQFRSAGIAKLLCAIYLTIFTLGLRVAASAQEPRIITINVPDANGTLAQGINALGVIAGFYLDTNNVNHGFLRARDGVFTTFEAPGAAYVPESYEGTFVYGLNLFGAVTGYYLDASDVWHGFVRSPSGAITTFEAPGAGSVTGSYQGTLPGSINDFGAIAGDYEDSSGVYHGFLRAPNGTITPFDPLGSVGTFPDLFNGINDVGAIAGAYLDSSDVSHGFVRARDGTITTINAPDAGTGSGQGTSAPCINNFGAIAGEYVDSSGVYHGFLRAPDGTITPFDVEGAGTGSGQGTMPANINDFGAITGDYVDSSGVYHGFLRAPNGTITPFNVPDAGTGSGQGTFPSSNNLEGAITGYYLDSSNVYHGFLRTP